MADNRSEFEIVKLVELSLDDRGWTDRSVNADDLRPRFAFLLHEAVSIDNLINRIQRRDPAKRTLRLPAFPRRNPLRATAAEVEGNEVEFAAYYRQIMGLTGPKPLRHEYYYWLHMTFVSDLTAAEIHFPYWDRLSAVAPFLAWLRTSPDGDNFFDCDQGWLLRAAHKAGRIHFQVGGSSEDQREFANVSSERAELLARIDVAEAQVRRVIARLSEMLGVDPWS